MRLDHFGGRVNTQFLRPFNRFNRVWLWARWVLYKFGLNLKLITRSREWICLHSHLMLSHVWVWDQKHRSWFKSRYWHLMLPTYECEITKSKTQKGFKSKLLTPDTSLCVNVRSLNLKHRRNSNPGTDTWYFHTFVNVRSLNLKHRRNSNPGTDTWCFPIPCASVRSETQAGLQLLLSRNCCGNSASLFFTVNQIFDRSVSNLDEIGIIFIHRTRQICT